MRGGFPKIYQSFEEFEREELRKLDGLSGTIDDMLDTVFAEELDFDEATVRKSRSRDEDD